MGWISSLPFFCAAIETITELTNATLTRCSRELLPLHYLEQATNPATTTLVNSTKDTRAHSESALELLAWSDQFVDDHPTLAQEGPQARLD